MVTPFPSSLSAALPFPALLKHMRTDQQNKEALNCIQKTLFGVCLDEGTKSGLEVTLPFLLFSLVTT